MADFYTIIALVLSVSGATYSAIAGLHYICKERIDEWKESIRLGNEKCQECGTTVTQACGTAVEGWFRLTKLAWGLSLAIPVLLFGVYSFYSSFVALNRYSDGSAKSSNVLQLLEPDLDSQFAWLRIVVWTNAACLVAAAVSLSFMRLAIAAMRLCRTQAEQIKSRATNPTSSDDPSPPPEHIPF